MKTLSPISRFLVCLLACAWPAFAAGAEEKVHTPEKGGAERKALLDGVHAAYSKQDSDKAAVIFTVPYVKIHGDWAWIRIEPQSKDGKQQFEPQSGLFQRQSGKWIFVTWEPSEEGTDTNAFFKELKAKHPGLPADILPK